MFLFKKKKKIEINSKFKMNELVNFKYQGELKFGRICDIGLDNENNIIYSIQVGGECPVVFNNIKEASLIRR